MPSHDDLGEGLLVRLRELFDAVETMLQGVAERGGEPPKHYLFLKTVHEQIRPTLIAEAERARPSPAATWYLCHLAVVLLEKAEMPDSGTGSGVYRQLNSVVRRFSEYLASAPPGPPDESPPWTGDWIGRLAQELSDDLVQSLPAPLSDAVALSLPAPLSTALAQSLPAPLSDALVQSLPTPLSNALALSLPAPLSTALVLSLPAPLSNALALSLPGPLTAALVLSLPDPLATPLSADLTQSLPGPVAQTIITAIEAAQDKTSEDIAALTALANAPLNQRIKSPADGINFLQDVLGALQAVEADTGAIPLDLVQPVTNAVLGVFNFAASAATITDLNTMIDLKQQIAEILKPTAPAVPVAVGGIQ